MLFSTLFFSFVHIVVKYLHHLPTFEIIFFRAFGSALCATLALRSRGLSLLGHNRKILLIRALCGLISVAFFFKSIQLMPLGTAVSLRYISPIFAVLFAAVFLKERVKKLQWFLFLVAFGGVLILKGFDLRISTLSFTYILISAVFSGLVYVIIRKIGPTEHPMVIINYFMVLATVSGGLVSLFNWVQPCGIEWLLLIAMGFLGFVAQVLMTKALQSGEANVVVPIKYIEVLISLVMGWFLFGDYQTWLQMLGISLIISTLVVNLWLKRRISRRDAEMNSA